MDTTIRRNWHVFVIVASLLLAFGASYALRATEVTGVTTTTMLNAVTTGTGTVIGPGYMPRCRESAVYINWSSGVSAGAVVVETAHDPNYTGTWATLSTVNWTAASKEDIVQITGIHAAIRTRVSSTIMNGTVSSFLTCN
jgi:hypothetical protein